VKCAICLRERENSEDEEDIPLTELQRRIRAKKIIDQEDTKPDSDSDATDDCYESDLEKREFLVADEHLSPKPEPLNEDMEIDAVVSVGGGFSNNDVTPVPSPQLLEKRPVPLPRKTKSYNKEKLAENLVATQPLRGGIHNFKNLYELFMKFHEIFMIGA
jgi:hypothetical protein